MSGFEYVESVFTPCYCVVSELGDEYERDKVKVKVYNPGKKYKHRTIEKRLYIDPDTLEEHIKKVIHCERCEEHTKLFFSNCNKIRIDF